MPAFPDNHLTNPILASIDAVSAIALIGYWFDWMVHPVAVISTGLAACWYGFCLFEAIERRLKRKD